MNNYFTYYPLQQWAGSNSLYSINITMLYHTLVCCLIIIAFAFITRFTITRNSLGGFFMQYIGEILYSFIHETLEFVDKNIFCVSFFLFLLTLVYNTASLIPHLEEPSDRKSVV